MSQQETHAPPPGISGKRVTGWVLLGLVTLGATLSYTLWSYSAINAARKVSTQHWRVVADKLSQRYRAVDVAFETSVANGTISGEAAKAFASALDRFRTTADANEQETAAVQVERLLLSAEIALTVSDDLSISPELQLQVAEFNRARQIERARLESLGGKIVDLFLEIPLPEKFQLASGD